MGLAKRFVLILVILIATSCYKTIDNSVSLKLSEIDWGMHRVDKIHPIPMEDDSTKFSVKFKPELSSERYEFRLFFPSLENVNDDSIFGLQKYQIINSLNGMTYSLTDLTSKEEILNVKITKENFFEYVSFNRNPGKPLSCWLSPYLQLNKKHKYDINLMVPKSDDVKKEFLDRVIVIGVGKSPMF